MKKTPYEILMDKHDHAISMAIKFKALGEVDLAAFYYNAAQGLKNKALHELAN